MKKFLLLFLLVACGLECHAANESDYPVFSLRGNNIGEPEKWIENVEGYVFTRQDNVYSLTVAELSGEFKISNADWTVNFGEDDVPTGSISDSQYINGKINGPNFSTNGVLKNVAISFKFDINNPDYTIITFIVDGHPILQRGISNTLPVLYINVYKENGLYDNEIISYNLDHKNYFTGEYWLDTNDCKWLEELGAKDVGSKEAPLPLQIKARGNWTRKGFSKKPFKIKLDKKQSLLGLSKSKHFTLLAHADDNFGYLRNFTGFNLGKRIGLAWTPQQQPVELVINGDYRGLYFLTEAIRIESDRIDIAELADNETNAALCSGGYLVELDNYDEPDESQIRMDEKGCVDGHNLDKLRITFDTPEVYSDVMRRFVSDQFATMNDLIGHNSDEIWKYLDLDDAVRYYIVEELISHTESYHGSTYLFRDFGEGQKWHFSPLWDCGNAFRGPDDNYFYNADPYGNTWIPSIRENAKFNQHLSETWKWFMSNEYDGIYEDLETYISALTSAASNDYQRWKDIPAPDGGQAVTDNRDLNGKLQSVKNKLKNKINWLKTRPDFGNFSDKVYSEPEADNTPAAQLPDYVKTSGVEDIEPETSSDCSYYNLQGLPIKTLKNGEIYIKVEKGKRGKLVKTT